ncbi:hypothetical protein HYH02_007450 [Chlamydomonas schloesseri]|uniref:Uncharacterized protein n=1 Tax=Chlamydomonas schloesseri TaxID=2026947 RepID=A0A835WI08_9CHLO|nr:hypothetical protein HYH02_007450 [Chlamydomonas schloesseri]|eukprot:KAG2447526.1 hypothetical protein HYH02_007450 [Chlamydomonas schloesseri]
MPNNGTWASGDELLVHLFGELPAIAPAVIALILYALAGAAALILTWRTRAWFMAIVTATAWLEALGFAARVLVIRSPSLNVYIGMQALLIITPVILPLVDYIVVGRLVALGDAGALHRWIKPHYIPRFFLASDVFTLMLQGAGGGLISGTDPKSRDMGRNLLLAGLFLQLGFFTAFTWLTAWAQTSKPFGLRDRTSDLVPRLGTVFACLYTTIVLMYVRNIFRTVEFIMGYDGYLATHEAFFYGFDFVPIFGSVLIFCVWHFGYYMPPPAKGAAAGSSFAAAGSSSAVSPVSKLEMMEAGQQGEHFQKEGKQVAVAESSADAAVGSAVAASGPAAAFSGSSGGSRSNSGVRTCWTCPARGAAGSSSSRGGAATAAAAGPGSSGSSLPVSSLPLGFAAERQNVVVVIPASGDQ